MVWGGRREEGSGWGTHVYLWQIHFDICQNQYNIVKLNKIKLKKNKAHLLLDFKALLLSSIFKARNQRWKSSHSPINLNYPSASLFFF